MISTEETTITANPAAGSNVAVPYPYRFDEEEHLNVTRISTAGVRTDLVEGVDYSVSGAGNTAGGTVTVFTVTAEDKIVIERIKPITQEHNLVTGGPLKAEELEGELDKGAMIDQQLQEGAERTIAVKSGEPKPVVSSAENRKSTFPVWDANGDYSEYTAAQIWASLPVPAGTVSNQGTVAFADKAARDAATPEVGQLAVQVNTNIVYEENGASAGDWVQVSVPLIESYAALAALDAREYDDKTRVHLVSYNANKFDKGAGVFVLDKSLSVIGGGNTGTVIDGLNVTDSYWRRQYEGNPTAEMFGAIPNDSTFDCRPAIQACLDAHQFCQLGKGTYFSRALTGPSSTAHAVSIFIGEGETIAGAGKGKTILKLPDDSIADSNWAGTPPADVAEVDANHSSARRAHMIGSGDANNVFVFFSDGEVSNSTVRDLSIDLNGNGQTLYDADRVCLAAVVLTGKNLLIENVDVTGHRSGANAECFSLSMSSDHNGSANDNRIGDILGCSVHDPADGNNPKEITSILASGKPKASDSSQHFAVTVQNCHIYNLFKTGSQQSTVTGITPAGYGVLIANNTANNIDGAWMWWNAFTATGDVMTVNNVGHRVGTGVSLSLTHPRIQYERIYFHNNVFSIGISPGAGVGRYGFYHFSTANATGTSGVATTASSDPNIVLTSPRSGLAGFVRARVYLTGLSGVGIPDAVYFIVAATDTTIQVSATSLGSALTPTGVAVGTYLLKDGYVNGMEFSDNKIYNLDPSDSGMIGIYVLSNREQYTETNNGDFDNYSFLRNMIDAPNVDNSFLVKGAIIKDFDTFVRARGNVDRVGKLLRYKYNHYSIDYPAGASGNHYYQQEDVSDQSAIVAEEFVSPSPGFDRGWVLTETTASALTLANEDVAEQVGVAQLSMAAPAGSPTIPSTIGDWSSLTLPTGIAANTGNFDYVLDVTIRLAEWLQSTDKWWQLYVGLLSPITDNNSPVAAHHQPIFSDGIYFEPLYAGVPDQRLKVKTNHAIYNDERDLADGQGDTDYIRMRVTIKGDFSYASAFGNGEATWGFQTMKAGEDADKCQGGVSRLFTSTEVNTTNEQINIPAHNYVNEQRVQFITTGTLPAGLSLATDYYVTTAGADHVTVSTTTPAGTPVDLTSGGTGTHQISPQAEDDVAVVMPTSATLYPTILIGSQATTGGSASIIRIANFNLRKVRISEHSGI